MIRVDTYPTHEYQGFKLRPGKPLPFGATIVPSGVNFSIFSRSASSCELVLYKKHEKEPFAIIPFFREFRIGNVFSMVVFDLDYENIEYGYRMDGPNNFQEGHWFNKDKVLLDPYAKAIGGREIWGKEPDWSNEFQHRGRIIFDDFDWQGDMPIEIPVVELIIYEMHVRGFTRHPSSGVKYPGTYAAIKEKIPYLLELGINCVELLPINEFDEFENYRISELTGENLLNYWGYGTVGFFAPKAGFAATGKFGMEFDELKALIKELHKNGIEVLLDVVFNHTAEGNENGPYISFRGLDNKTYYMLTPEGYYYNFSGCGNTLNCNNPIVRNMILDCLRYWAAEYHIDGFRFDLAAILGRDQNGAPMSNPPLLEILAFDPVLGKCKLVAEAWDAGGLYQVGSFPSSGRWAEWNGKYRDDIRKFIKSEPGMLGTIQNRISGSPDLYKSQNRGARASINFITCHDGFNLMDLVSYDCKHNDANGEGNRDGGDDNCSWNNGWEGPVDNWDINRARIKQIKNAVTLLMISHGIPMILSGDEMGKTQNGNNNAYCQDNELSWLNWEDLKKNQEIFDFFKGIIAFRKSHPILRQESNFEFQNAYNGYPSLSFHGQKAWNVEYNDESYCLGVMYCGNNLQNTLEEFIYVAINMHWEMHGFELPSLPDNLKWHVAVNTCMNGMEDIWSAGEERYVENQCEVLVDRRSIMILLAK
jgi:glycogen operon protein